MNTKYINEYLNIILSKANEWTLYKTAIKNMDTMNIASHSLNENEYENKGKNKMCTEYENMGNYNDEINDSIKMERALKETQDVYDTQLQVKYGLFEDPLQLMNIMYLIEHNMLASIWNTMINNKHADLYDDIHNHLLHTCYQHCDDNNNTQDNLLILNKNYNIVIKVLITIMNIWCTKIITQLNYQFLYIQKHYIHMSLC